MVSDSDNAAAATVRDQGPASKRFDETFPAIAAGSGNRTVSPTPGPDPLVSRYLFLLPHRLREVTTQL